MCATHVIGDDDVAVLLLEFSSRVCFDVFRFGGKADDKKLFATANPSFGGPI